MGKTDNFRKQHVELLDIAEQISKQLNAVSLSQDATKVRSLLSQLLSKLKLHLSSEDKYLYPQLLNHSDENLKSVAKKFIDEMGGIGQVVTEYRNKWNSPIPIQKDAHSFVNETKGLFSALAQRIEKENNELYPLVDNS